MDIKVIYHNRSGMWVAYEGKQPSILGIGNSNSEARTDLINKLYMRRFKDE